MFWYEAKRIHISGRFIPLVCALGKTLSPWICQRQKFSWIPVRSRTGSCFCTCGRLLYPTRVLEGGGWLGQKRVRQDLCELSPWDSTLLRCTTDLTRSQRSKLMVSIASFSNLQKLWVKSWPTVTLGEKSQGWNMYLLLYCCCLVCEPVTTFRCHLQVFLHKHKC